MIVKVLFGLSCVYVSYAAEKLWGPTPSANLPVSACLAIAAILGIVGALIEGLESRR